MKRLQFKNIAVLLLAPCMLMNVIIALVLRLIFSGGDFTNPWLLYYCITAGLHVLGIVYVVTLFFKNKANKPQDEQSLSVKISLGIIVCFISFAFWLFTLLFNDNLGPNLEKVLLFFYSSIHLAVCIIILLDFTNALIQSKSKENIKTHIKKNLILKILFLTCPAVISLIVIVIFFKVGVDLFFWLVLLPSFISSILSLIFFFIDKKRQNKMSSTLFWAVMIISNFLSAALCLTLISTFLWLFFPIIVIIPIIIIILNLGIIVWFTYRRNIEEIKIKTLENYENESD